jgi:hypothetical protein
MVLAGYRPVIRVLAIVEDSEANSVEQDAIYMFSMIHPFQLLNKYHTAKLSEEELSAAVEAESREMLERLRASLWLLRR